MSRSSCGRAGHLARAWAFSRSWDGERYVLADLGSKNGTYVNHRPLTGPHPLRDGDLIMPAGRDELALVFDGAGKTVTAASASLPGGGLWIDTAAGEVWLRGRRVDLAADEYRTVVALYERAGATVRPEELAAAAWPEGGPGVVALSDLVERLRRKVERDPAQPRVVTSAADGYRPGS